MIGVLGFWLLACGGEEPMSVAQQALVENASELADCDMALFTEMATTCRVLRAIESAASGDVDAAGLACGAVRDALWRDECHFRVAEELGRVGRIQVALRHCAKAGDFASDCVSQTAWRYPRWEARVRVYIDGGEAEDEGLIGPRSEEAPRLLATFEEEVRLATSGLDEALQKEAMDQLISAVWFNVYFGSGVADPALARSATGAHAAPARTAFALEAVRLVAGKGGQAADQVAAQVRRIWEGEEPPVEGSPILRGSRSVRYSVPAQARGTGHLDRTGTWGGGKRLLGATADDDLDVAILHAIFCLEKVPPEALVGFLEDSRDRVRWTAAQLYAQLTGQDNPRIQEMLEGQEVILKDLVWQALVATAKVPGWMEALEL
jgi:hypothetical protein